MTIEMAMASLTLASCDIAFGNRGDCDLGDPSDPCAHVCNNSERGHAGGHSRDCGASG